MNKFDGRSAVKDYMSSHPLSYSTPDLILKEFVIWLCEQIDDPVEGKEKIPRIMLYSKLEEQESISSYDTNKDSSQNPLFKSGKSDIPAKGTTANKPEGKFCIECGLKLNPNTRFCTRCGTKQEDI
jgi:zinc-ribbon domain